MTVQVSKLTKVETISILVCTLIICKSFNTVCNVFLLMNKRTKLKLMYMVSVLQHVRLHYRNFIPVAEKILLLLENFQQ